MAVLWKRNVECQIIDSSYNHIDIHVMKNFIAAWLLTCYYGYPERIGRRVAWDMLRKLAVSADMPWCIFDDFNDLLYDSDKKGPHPHPQYLLDSFRLAIENCGLTEIDLVEGDFTWERSKRSPSWVRERLDRAFANDAY